MNPQAKKGATARIALGSFVLLTGLWITGMAFGVFEFDDSKLHVPLWVFALCGLAFVTAGIMSFIGLRVSTLPVIRKKLSFRNEGLHP